MKAVSVVILVSSLNIGGAEQLLLQLLKNINREKFDIKLYFLRDPGSLGQEILKLGFPATTNIIKSKFDIAGILKLAKLLKNRDVLFMINHLNALFYGVLAAKLAKIPRSINWHNETFRKYPFHRISMLCRRILHLGVDKIVAAAFGHKKYITSHEKIPANKIVLIYNSVDPKNFISYLSREEAKRKLQIPVNSQVISIVAALRKDKAHEIFLNAAKIVLQKIPDAHFLIIGDGIQREYLAKISDQLGLEKNVHFLGFQRKIGDILAAVDINTISSRPQQETLSVAALEAMSAGIPIVSTDVGFMKEIVIYGKTGFLVKVDDYIDMAEKIIYILKNQSIKDKMSESARSLVYEKFGIEKMVADFETLLSAGKS